MNEHTLKYAVTTHWLPNTQPDVLEEYASWVTVVPFTLASPGASWSVHHTQLHERPDGGLVLVVVWETLTRRGRTVRYVCPSCDGTGHADARKDVRCTVCLGDGTLSRDQAAVLQALGLSHMREAL